MKTNDQNKQVNLISPAMGLVLIVLAGVLPACALGGAEVKTQVSFVPPGSEQLYAALPAAAQTLQSEQAIASYTNAGGDLTPETLDKMGLLATYELVAEDKRRSFELATHLSLYCDYLAVRSQAHARVGHQQSAQEAARASGQCRAELSVLHSLLNDVRVASR